MPFSVADTLGNLLACRIAHPLSPTRKERYHIKLTRGTMYAHYLPRVSTQYTEPSGVFIW
jgi:hypothetical protein